MNKLLSIFKSSSSSLRSRACRGRSNLSWNTILSKIAAAISWLRNDSKFLLGWWPKGTPPRWNLTQAGFIKLTKRGLVIMMVALIVFTGSGLYLLMKPKPASAAWYDESWAYRQAVTVTVSSSSSDITSLETLLTIDTTGITDKLQTSCEDLRFTNTNGKLLPYYIDTCSDNSATNKVWVLADLVPKNTTTYTLYMYYGNPSATSASDSTKFRLFNGLVGYWMLNDGGSSATAADSSVNANTGTLSIGASGTQTTNAQAWSNGSSGKYSASLNFDGTDDYVSMPAGSTLRTQNGSISLWAKRDTSDTSSQGVWEIYTDDSNRATLFWSTSTSKWAFAIRNTASGLKDVFSNSTFTDSNWHHLIGTWGDNGLSLYIDGKLQSDTDPSTIGTDDLGTTTSHAIGKSFLTSDNLPFTGQIDDVRVYNRTLSASEITQLYTNPGTIASNANATVKPSTSFASEEKSPGPIAYWKFDDGQGTTAQDSTTNNLDGTLNNTPTWQTEDMCIAGKCLYFDGTNNENVSKSDDSKLDFAAADNFTIGAWVKRNGTSSANNFILTKAQSGYTGYKLYQDSSGDYCFDVSDGTNTDTACTSAVEFDDNNWHLVQGVKSGTTSITLYIDGKQRAQDSSIAATGTLANTGTFYIGVDLDGTSNEWLGFIDEVKVYPYARSAAQIQADYNTRGTSKGLSLSTQGETLKNLSNGLVGYWKMDEAAANSCTGGVNDSCDSSGNGNNGAWNGDATSAGGKFGNGVTFDGTGDSVSIFDNNSLDITTTGSVGFWIKYTSTPTGWAAPLWKNDSGINATTNYGFSNKTPGSLNISGILGNGSTFIETGAVNMTTNTWSHIIMTWDGSRLRLYKDGALVQDVAQTITPAANVKSIGLGDSSGGGTFIGTIDDVRIYNRALSPNEVSQLYNFAPGPRVELKMEEGSGTSTNDSSGNSRTGTINGNPVWAPGKFGKGIKMDGTGDNVQISDF